MWTVAFYQGTTYRGICPNTKSHLRTDAELWAQWWGLAYPYTNGHYAAVFLHRLAPRS